MAVAQQASLEQSTAQLSTTSRAARASLAAEHASTSREVSLRRVAIVLSSLPAHVANRLMAGLTAESKYLLREAINELVDVDPLERHRAFQAFKGSLLDNRLTSFDEDSRQTRRSGSLAPTSRVVREAEWDSSPVGSSSLPPTRPPSSSAVLPELAFLEDIEDDVLARLIAGEHPQAIALVLASIAPAQAARVVTTLSPPLQTETLNRIARLDEASLEAIADLTDHLRAKAQSFGSQASLHGGSPNGKQALQAILAAMPRGESAARTTVHQSPSPENPVRHPADRESSKVPQPATVPRLAIETWPEPNAANPASHAASLAPVRNVEPSLRQPAAERPLLFPSTDAIHQHLIQLPPQELCRALAAVDERQALLALCGLPNQIAEKVLAVLPRGQAKQIRMKLSSLGGLQLREIDAAKEWVALTSIGRAPAQATLPITDRQSVVANPTNQTPQRVPLAA